MHARARSYRFGRVIPMAGIVLASALLLPRVACGWGPATHLYLLKRLVSDPGVVKRSLRAAPSFRLNALYGAGATDVPGVVRSEKASAFFFLTHGEYGRLAEGAMARHRRRTAIRAFALGFVSHNGAEWGTDLDAHPRVSPADHGQGCSPSSEGYVCEKVNTLLQTEAFRDADPLTAEAYLEVCVDLLVKFVHDRHIGRRLARSARSRNRRISPLLQEVYQGELVPGIVFSAPEIETAEERYRLAIRLYGEAIAATTKQDLSPISGLLGPALVASPQEVAARLQAVLELIEDEFSPSASPVLDSFESLRSRIALGGAGHEEFCRLFGPKGLNVARRRFCSSR